MLARELVVSAWFVQEAEKLFEPQRTFEAIDFLLRLCRVGRWDFFFSISEPNLMIRFTFEQFDALHFQWFSKSSNVSLKVSGVRSGDRPWSNLLILAFVSAISLFFISYSFVPRERLWELSRALSSENLHGHRIAKSEHQPPIDVFSSTTVTQNPFLAERAATETPPAPAPTRWPWLGPSVLLNKKWNERMVGRDMILVD